MVGMAVRIERHAHYLVNRAKRKGVLVAPKICEQCHKKPTKRISAHHEDYDKPLGVQWLCEKCHRAITEAQKKQKAQIKHDLWWNLAWEGVFVVDDTITPEKLETNTSRQYYKNRIFGQYTHQNSLEGAIYGKML